MKTFLIAAASALLATSVAAQTAPQTTAPQVQAPVLAPAQAAPDCGGLLAVPAFCVTAPMAAIETLADGYVTHFAGEGWIAADGDDNRVIFVKRREGGGCDGMQMIAFYDTSRVATAESPGYLGMAMVPGDVCTAAPAPSAQPAAPEAAPQ